MNRKKVSEFFQRIPHFKGKLRVARFLVNILGWKHSPAEIRSKHTGLVYSLPNLNENLALEIFANGEYEPEIVTLIERILKITGGAFVDVGANIGSITMPLAKKMKSVHFFLIEASPWIFNVLKHNLETNSLTNVQPFNFCMSDRQMDAVKFFAPKGKFGKGSMKQVFTDEFELVESITLDQLIINEKVSQVTLIKVDVEGFEQQVFAGGKELLSRYNSPVIIFEAVNWAEELAGNEVSGAQKLLKEYGYKIFEIDGNGKLKSTDSEVNSSFCMLAAIKEFHVSLLQKSNLIN
jgi:FkbM family methyltransferase